MLIPLSLLNISALYLSAFANDEILLEFDSLRQLIFIEQLGLHLDITRVGIESIKITKRCLEQSNMVKCFKRQK